MGSRTDIEESLTIGETNQLELPAQSCEKREACLQLPTALPGRLERGSPQVEREDIHVQVEAVSESVQAPGRGRARVLCATAVIAVLIATLWPFNPFPPNGVHWLQGANGLRFENAGLVVSDEALKPPETDAPESYSLELLLRPASAESYYTILSIYAPTRPKQFLVRQWTDGLLVTHDAGVNRDRTRTIKFDVDHVFRPGRLVLVSISSGSKGTTVYVDGQSAETIPRFTISRSELSGEIVLGTSPVTYHPWLGELQGLAIYSKELTSAEAIRHYKEWIDPSGHPDLDGSMARFTFAEAAGGEIHNEVASGPNLEIPARFSVPHKDLLRSAVKEFSADRMYIIDVLMNIAGFIPLGLIACACFGWTRGRWQAILIATVVCSILSFVIEVLQFYIPKRGSGTTDIITNTLGAALGAMLTQTAVVRRILERIKVIRGA
jgi:VanZ family protein